MLPSRHLPGKFPRTTAGAAHGNYARHAQEMRDAMVKLGAVPQMLCWIGYAEPSGFLAVNNMIYGRYDGKA